MFKLRRLVPLVIVFLIAYAGWKVGTKYLNYFEFKNAVEEIARFAAGRQGSTVLQQVMQAAQKNDIPLEAQQVHIQQDGSRTKIDLSYTEQLEVLPRYFYPWDVTISIDSVEARAVR